MAGQRPHFRRALAEHRAGALDSAERLYRQVLAEEPGHVDALVNLAALSGATGRMREAEALCIKALEADPRCLNALVNLAAARHALGEVDGAAEALERAVALAPREASLLVNLAVLRRLQGRLADCRALLERARGIAPDHPETLFQLGILSLQEDTATKARAFFRAATERQPNHAEAQFNLAVLSEQAGALAEARERYRQALRAEPTHADALNNLGLLLDKQEDRALALALLRRAVAAAPGVPEYRYNLGSILAEREDYEAAAAELREALRLAPNYDAARLRLGNLHTDRGEYESAAACYEAVLARDPGHVVGRSNLALLRQYQGDFEGAEAEFRRAIAADPGHAAAHFNLALLLLRQERFAEGWREYEWRWKVLDSLPPEAPLPLWDGTPLRRRGILVLGEQGPGDMVMFASCLPDLLADADRVVLTAEPRLVDLLQRSFPRLEVRAADYRTVPEAPQGCALAIAVGSLPGIYRRRAEDFRRSRAPYLTPHPEALAHWRARLAALGPGLKVGISWYGGVSPSERRFRGMTLEDWRPLLETPDVHFVNLQYGKHRADAAAFCERTGIAIADWEDADPVKRFDDHVAQVASLDLVVTVANTVVHAAGSTGTPAIVLVPAVPSWRWGLARGDCLWYPGVELLRQAPGEAWRAVVQRAAQGLARRHAAA